MSRVAPSRIQGGLRPCMLLCASQFTGKKGTYTKIADTLASFDAITSGDVDDLPEQAFLYVGGIEEARARAK